MRSRADRPERVELRQHLLEVHEVTLDLHGDGALPREPPHLRHRAAIDDAALRDDADVCADALDVAEDVRGDDDRAVVARELADELHHLPASGRIEA